MAQKRSTTPVTERSRALATDVVTALEINEGFEVAQAVLVATGNDEAGKEEAGMELGTDDPTDDRPLASKGDL